MNIASMISRAALEFPDHTAVAWGNESRTSFSGLAARVASLARGLPALAKTVPGDRVVIFAANRPEYVEVLFACWWAGLVVVPVNAKLHATEVRQIIVDSGATVVLTCPKLAQSVESVVPPGVLLIDMASSTYAKLLDATPAAMVHCGADTLAWLFYTSGTTGFPKGAMITHGNLRALVAGYLADVDGIESGDALIHAAPMSHGSGLYILPFLAAGAAQVIPSSGGFDEEELFDLIAGHPRCSLFAAPTMVRRMVRFASQRHPDHSNLRTVIYGGGPLYYDDLLDATRQFGERFAQIYGQGECPMSITSMRRSAFSAAVARDDEVYLRSVGLPFSFNEVCIRDEAGNELPQGEVGEVSVRSPAVCLGYWNNPEATVKTFRDGWLFTGDLGRITHRGVLVLAGRSKEVIISGGTNIYPIEVEDALLSHPQVLEAAVIGIPDPEWGEAVVAYVVASGTTEGLARALDCHCTDRIARFKRPKTYRIVAELPKNNYGKIVKRELVERERTL